MREHHPREVILKDGQAVTLRAVRPEDAEALKAFFHRIPAEERWHFRHDVTDEALVESWAARPNPERTLVVVAEAAGRIVAEATLNRRPFGPLRHVGLVRLVVEPEFRNRRLGTWLFLDLINLAVSLGLERLRADFVVGVEDAAIQGARRLDFFEAATLSRYARSPEGKYYDYLIMIKRLNAGWDDF